MCLYIYICMQCGKVIHHIGSYCSCFVKPMPSTSCCTMARRMVAGGSSNVTPMSNAKPCMMALPKAFAHRTVTPAPVDFLGAIWQWRVELGMILSRTCRKVPLVAELIRTPRCSVRSVILVIHYGILKQPVRGPVVSSAVTQPFSEIPGDGFTSPGGWRYDASQVWVHNYEYLEVESWHLRAFTCAWCDLLTFWIIWIHSSCLCWRWT